MLWHPWRIVPSSIRRNTFREKKEKKKQDADISRRIERTSFPKSGRCFADSEGIRTAIRRSANYMYRRYIFFSRTLSCARSYVLRPVYMRACARIYLHSMQIPLTNVTNTKINEAWSVKRMDKHTSRETLLLCASRDYFYGLHALVNEQTSLRETMRRRNAGITVKGRARTDNASFMRHAGWS